MSCDPLSVPLSPFYDMRQLSGNRRVCKHRGYREVRNAVMYKSACWSARFELHRVWKSSHTNTHYHPIPIIIHGCRYHFHGYRPHDRCYPDFHFHGYCSHYWDGFHLMVSDARALVVVPASPKQHRGFSGAGLPTRSQNSQTELAYEFDQRLTSRPGK